MPTARLYYDDPTLVRFGARVVARRGEAGASWVELDRTAFYPASGGQPHDLGTLRDAGAAHHARAARDAGAAGGPSPSTGARVLEVKEESDSVFHRVEGEIAGERVEGEIDWPRRFDHMQQHTAQHVLSRVLLDEFGSRTIGFGIGETESHVDLDRVSWPDETWNRVEDRVAERIRTALPVRSRIITPSEARAAGVKVPEGLAEIRVVTIADLDRQACGGTHLRGTHEIELLKLVRTERLGARLRLYYLAGGRARRDFQWKHETLRRLALSITSGMDAVEPTWNRMRETIDDQRRRLAAQGVAILDAALAAWLAAVPGDPRIVARVVEDLPAEAVTAHRNLLGGATRAVLLLGWREADRAWLLFTRTPDVDLDVRPLLARAVAIIGGKGGGRPERAQGAGPGVGDLERAIEEAARETRSRLAST
jgi:alanyl-tRNA synthetase